MSTRISSAEKPVKPAAVYAEAASNVHRNNQSINKVVRKHANDDLVRTQGDALTQRSSTVHSKRRNRHSQTTNPTVRLRLTVPQQDDPQSVSDL